MSDDTAAAVMDATHCALCEHGYADLTMQRIADESDLSKSALHYHYDSKRELILAFLDHLYERYESRLRAAEADADSPRDRLFALVDESLGRDDDSPDFRTALMEVKAQSPYDEGFRDRLVEFDDLLRGRFAAALREGQETEDVAADVDPDAAAALLVTMVSGVHTRYVAAGARVETSRDRIRAYVARDLLVDGNETVSEVGA